MPASLLEQFFAEAQAKGLITAGFKDGLPSGVPDNLSLMGGPNSLWGGAYGVERQLISTHVHGTGLATRLPAFATNLLWPTFGYITGFQDIPDDFNPDGPCDDPPTVGHMKVCEQTAHFGLYKYKTREFDIARAGELINRADPVDLVIMNDPLLERMSNITPNVPGVGGTPNMRREMLVRMMELGVAFQRKLGRQVYIGDPTNATAGGGYDEFPGVDKMIIEGHVDARDGVTTCPSLDSVIHDFDYGLATDGDAGPPNLFDLMISIFHYMKGMSEDTGLSPVKWVWVMRRDLFYILTAMWPCLYVTSGCTFIDAAGQQRVNVDARDQIDFRDAMRQGNYLLMDSERVEVVLDSYLPEETWVTAPGGSGLTAGQYASDIYLIPLTVAGNVQSTYWQYFNYGGDNGPMQAANDARLGQFFWTDNGLFFWHAQPPSNSCVVLTATTRPRIIMRTPHLAARIMNVGYEPVRHGRDVLPSDSFWVNGGRTSDLGVVEPKSEWNPA